MGFGDGFRDRSIPWVDPLPNTASMIISNPDGNGWIPASIEDQVISASVNIHYHSEVSSSGNIQGNGLSGSEITLKDNISLTSVTSSFSGNLTGTASYSNNSNLLDGLHASQFLTTSSFNDFSSSYNTGSFTGSFYGQFSGSSVSSSTANISQLLTNYVDLNISSASPAFQTGRLHYETATGDIEYDTDVAGVSLKVGQQTILKIHNDLGAVLTKGKLVRFNNANNNSLIAFATTASWTDEAQSAHTIGMVVADIAVGAVGYVILEGVLLGVNTSNYNNGDLLFLSSSGNFTNNPPALSDNYHSVRIGQVIRVGNSSNGAVFIKVDNGYEIDELHNVRINGVEGGDLLSYSSGTLSRWTNTKTLSGTYAISGNLNVTGYISGSNITASYALSAVTSSYSANTSLAQTASYSTNASIANTASYVQIAQTASYVTASSIGNFSADVRKQITGSQYVSYNTGSGVVSLPYTGSLIGTTPVILGQNVTELNGLSQISASVVICNTFVSGSQALGANLQVLTGSNRPAGTVNLSGGPNSSATVANSLVTANSIIIITKQTATKNNAAISISAKSSGSFTIISNLSNDTDTVGYLILNPI